MTWLINLIWLGACYILIVCLSSTRTIFFLHHSPYLTDVTAHKQFYKLDLHSYSGHLYYKDFQITSLHFVRELDAGVGKNLIDS